jgi:hypothetical protein
MGISFLSSYIREFLIRKKHIARKSFTADVVFKNEEVEEQVSATAYIIIDANNFVMRLYRGDICDSLGLPRLPYVNGNNTLLFYQYMRHFLTLMKKNGIRVVFVYDGHTSDNENREEKGDAVRQTHLEQGELFRENQKKLNGFCFQRTVRLNNVKDEVTDDELKKYFEKFDPNIKIVSDLKDHRGKFRCMEVTSDKAFSTIVKRRNHVIVNKCVAEPYDMNNRTHRPIHAWSIIDDFMIKEFNGYVESTSAVEEADSLVTKLALEKSQETKNVFIFANDSDYYIQQDLNVMDGCFKFDKNGVVSFDYLDTNEVIDSIIKNTEVNTYEELVTMFSVLFNDYTPKDIVTKLVTETLEFSDPVNINPASLFKHASIYIRQQFEENKHYEDVIKNIYGESNSAASISFVNSYLNGVQHIQSRKLVPVTILQIAENAPWTSRRIVVTCSPPVTPDELWLPLLKQFFIIASYASYFEWSSSDTQQIKLKMNRMGDDSKIFISNEILNLNEQEYNKNDESDRVSQFLKMWKHPNMSQSIQLEELEKINNPLLRPYAIVFCYLLHTLADNGLLGTYVQLFEAYLLSILKSADSYTGTNGSIDLKSLKIPLEKFLGDQYYHFNAFLQVGAEIYIDSCLILDEQETKISGCLNHEYFLLCNGLEQGQVYENYREWNSSLDEFAKSVTQNYTDWKTIRQMILSCSSVQVANALNEKV